MAYRKLGDILVARGVISSLQLSVALAAQQTSHKRMGEVLVERGFATEEQIAQCLAEQYGYGIVELDADHPEAEALCLIPADVALEHAVLPMRVLDDTLECAMADPLDVVTTDLVGRLSRKRVQINAAPQSKLIARVRQVYGLEETPGHRFAKVQPRRRVGDSLLFDAHDQRLDRQVTLVCLPNEKREQRLALARAAGRTTSKWVCAVYDWLEHDGSCWIVLEHVEGESLANVLRTRGPRSLSQIATTVAQIAEGVDDLHQAGGHCGLICPENVVLRPGAAQLAPLSLPSALYSAPEVMYGGKPVPASDVYAVGTLIAHCLAGHEPHDPGPPVRWAKPDGICPVGPPALREVLLSCLDSEPEVRYASALLIAKAMRSYNWSSMRTTVTVGRPAVDDYKDREKLLDSLDAPPEAQRRPWWRLFARRAA
jgi:hypothetical protein